MRSRRMMTGIGGVMIATIAIIVIAMTINDAPDVTEAQIETIECIREDTGETCIRFPMISGDNLTGMPVTYPRDFSGTYTLTVLPFDRDQQVIADTWLPYVRELGDEYSEFSYYNIPVFPDLDTGFRIVARAGLVLLIQDAFLREITTTVFLDNRDEFLSALDIPDVELIQILLLNDNNEVVWRESGEFTAEKGEALVQLLDELLVN